jgi:hypothetical protein
LLLTPKKKIVPLLPLQLLNENKTAKFSLATTATKLLLAKLSSYLYDNSKALLLTKKKMQCKRTFDDLDYLNRINPNYKDADKFMAERT